MQVKWDYTTLAEHYDQRADYSLSALKAIFDIMKLPQESLIADIGAGTGKLSLPLLGLGYRVTAVEPNDAMRAIGIQNTAGRDIEWLKATGEDTTLSENTFDAFTMGSSFNVVEQNKCLSEAARVLKSKGWFVVMWNHRDLEDPIQKSIESCITSHIENYDYGSRRQDPTDIIASSEYFETPLHVSGRFFVNMPKEAVIEAWRSHATLQRQAGEKFAQIISDIEDILSGKDSIEVPYRTNIWISQKTT